MTKRHIIAGSGGFQFINWQMRAGPIIEYACEVTKKDRPKIAYIGTAAGDDSSRIAGFYDACSRINVSPSHLTLFTKPNHANVEEYLLSQDIIWVTGGSVVNLLAVWRAHGLDAILRKCWEAGVILMGSSAGSICWHTGGTTDSFGMELKPVTNSLGFLPYSSGVHYDSEEQRRPLFQHLIQDGTLDEGYATDDGVSLHFINETLHQAVSDTEGKQAYFVHRTPDGKVEEETITPQLLTKSAHFENNL